MPHLGQNSLNRLEGVHPDIVAVVKRAIEITQVDFGVVQGVRTQAYQDELYAQGRTKPGPKVTWTRNSKHIQQDDGYGHAVDLAAYVGGSISWAPQFYDDIALAMKAAAKELGIAIKWGPDIGIKGDLGHWEI